MISMFLAISGILFWVIILTWFCCGTWQYFRWTKEDKAELAEAMTGVRKRLHPVVQHMEMLLICIILFPMYAIASFYKEE